MYIFSGSKVIAEYASGAAANSPTTEYVYAGSQLLANLDAAGNPTYHYPDHLSTRIEADNTISSTHTFTRSYGHLPFGETWYENGPPDKWNFTSYESDGESGLQYADLRYQSPVLGRFISPDREAGSSTDPQSLNRYSYALNDPGRLVDPFGAYLGVPSGCYALGDPSKGEPQVICPIDTIFVFPLTIFGTGEGTGTSTDTIAQRLKQLLNLLDPKCLQFLNGKGGPESAQQFITDMLKYHDQDSSWGFGVATMPPKQNNDGSMSIKNAVSNGFIVG